MDVERFRELPVMGILRGGDAGLIAELVETVVAAGLETLEIAMNTPDAPVMIARAAECAGGRLSIGAGTVLTVDDMDAALGAGATFIVSPVLIADVISECVARGVPVFPGAITPKEIHDAWCAGATMVKVFPAKFFGPEYIREVKGPFADIELMACGGVSAGNVAEYFAAGASAVAFGGSVFSASRFAAHDFVSIGAEVASLVAACPGRQR